MPTSDDKTQRAQTELSPQSMATGLRSLADLLEGKADGSSETVTAIGLAYVTSRPCDQHAGATVPTTYTAAMFLEAEGGRAGYDWLDAADLLGGLRELSEQAIAAWCACCDGLAERAGGKS